MFTVSSDAPSAAILIEESLLFSPSSCKVENNLVMHVRFRLKGIERHDALEQSITGMIAVKSCTISAIEGIAPFGGLGLIWQPPMIDGCKGGG